MPIRGERDVFEGEIRALQVSSGVFVESSLLVPILQDSPGVFCEFVQDSFTITDFQDRVRELQEETGGRGYSDECGGGKYLTLTILTSLIFFSIWRFEFFLSILSIVIILTI